MKKEFIYESREEAYEGVVRSYILGVDFNDYQAIDYYFAEIIRDGREDEYWLLKVIFLIGSDNSSIIEWLEYQLDEGGLWSPKCYKLISKTLSLYRQNFIKKKFDFNTHKEAYDAFLASLNDDYDPINGVDYWFREFIRESPDDRPWLNLVINAIGHEEAVVKHWFFCQVRYPEFWSDKSYDLIDFFADALDY